MEKSYVIYYLFSVKNNCTIFMCSAFLIKQNDQTALIKKKSHV